MTPARFRWGMLLVLLGLVLLLRNMDVINSNFWEDFLVYSPILLIAIGVEKIFTKSHLQFISYATSIFLLAGGLYLAFAAGSGGISQSFFSKSSYSHAVDPGVKDLQVTLDLGNGNLTVRDATDDLVSGQFDEFTHKPDVKYSVEGSTAMVNFTTGKHRFWGNTIKINTEGANDWYLSFSNLIPLTLECVGKGSDIHLNLATTPTRKVKVEAADGQVYLKVGTIEPSVDVSVTGENSDVRLRLPSNAGVKISGVNDTEYLSRVGLIEEDGAYVNPGYDTLKNKINVNLDDRESSLSIDYY
ncbi:MAG TPA: toast rack family protein [Candidatus Acidoferrum sp.]|nr:toast rack family protein [Candidatus Acidoferrum sp.]